VAAAALATVVVNATAAAPPIQQTAEVLRPDPSLVRGDRGRPAGCPIRGRAAGPLTCVHGSAGGAPTVVLYGDSKAMQHFPALDAIAERRGWRLVAISRAGCPPMTVRYAHRCDRWRERALRELERIDPALVVTSSGVAYDVVARGRRLSHAASRPILRRAWVSTLRRIARRDRTVAVIANPPRAPRDPVACVSANRDRLDRCAFPRGAAPYRNYVVRGARRAGVARVDVNQVACPARVCPAVIGDVLVYRDRVHLTATYVLAIAGWIEERLPVPRGA
jgi:hypothetical protein